MKIIKSVYAKIFALSFVFILIVLFAKAQGNSQWISVNPVVTPPSAIPNKVPDVVNMYQINWKNYSQLFYADTSTSFTITLPAPQSEWISFKVTDANVLSKQTQLYFPDVRTYKGSGINNAATIRITVSNVGLIINVSNGENSYSITPVYKNDPNFYYVYNKKSAPGYRTATMECLEKDDNKPAILTRPANSTPTVLGSVGDCQLRTYRLAVAATDEYTASVGSVANAIADITATVNDVNAIYEDDATVNFTLVTTPAIIFNTGGADPYPTQAGPDLAYLQQNVSTLDSLLGNANYDVGIVFNGDVAWAPSGAKGLGNLYAACVSSLKGEAAAGGQICTGSSFANCVAHEIGHLFGCTHTFASTTGGCNGNVSLSTSYEPGSGSTIMSYAGVCTGTDYAINTDGYFHSTSADQIQAFAMYSATCATITPLTNHPPVLSASGSSYTIPISTPFKLTAIATDQDNDIINYCWEEIDAASVATTTSPSATATSGPNFRSFPPVSSGTRYFPNLPSLAAGTATPYEVLPSVARTINFAVTARDNAAGGGCNDEQFVAVTTANTAGPFIVTSQNTATALVANGTNTFNVTWNVAGTNAAPVNTSNVNILYSIDGGATYPYTLSSNVPNTGSATLLVPNLPSCAGRIMVAAVNNIFFNINSAPITITSSCAANGATFAPDDAQSATVGSPALVFSLAPQYGTAYTLPITGSLSSTDSSTFLAVVAAGACAEYNGNIPTYKSYNIRANQAGNYTFNINATSGTLYPVLNLYNGTYDPTSTCTNFLGSTYTNGVGNSPFTQNLCPDLNYTLVISGFDATQTVGNYSIIVTPPAGGALYAGGEASPGVGFSYAYVIVDTSTNKIVNIVASADLSNSSSYPVGQYSVYGLSYATGINLSSYIGTAFSNLTTAAQNFTLCANLSNDSKLVNITPGTVLAIGILSFNGTLINDHALLTWNTSIEQNNKGFEVMKSYDGQSFEEIGFVNGAGNSTEEKNYIFNDPAIAQNVQYYKINELDFNNVKGQTSSVVVLEDPTAKVFIENTYTVPSVNTLFIKTGNMYNSTTNINITIVDDLGQVVKSITMPYQTQTIDMSTFIPGTYFVQIMDVNGSNHYSNKVLRY